MGWTVDPHSLRWRLPLLISALVFVVLTTFLGVTYREVTGLQLEAAGSRAQFAADQLATSVSQSSPLRLRETQRLAANPGIVACVAHETVEACQSASTALEAVPSTAPRVVELWSGAGKRLLSIPASPTNEAAPKGDPPSRAVVGIGRLRAIGGTVYSETVVEVPAAVSATATDTTGAPSNPAGFLIVRRRVVASATRDLLNQLVGSSASIKLGNQTGDVWTDLATQVPAPSVDLARPGIGRYRSQGGRTYVGALSYVKGTPAATWVEFPEDVVLAESRALLRRMTMIGSIFLVMASLMAWALSARLTTPLRNLTEQAEAIAAGDYTRKVATHRRDEIGRLTIASNEMADRIRDAHHDLERRVVDRTAALAEVNDELESFSYSVSHDLRAPLRHINGFASLLGESAGPRLGEQDRRYLATITDAAGRMGQLIDDLLAFSRAGRSPLSKKPVKLPAIIEEVRREVLSAVNGRAIMWTIHPLPDVDADPAMLRQVAVNLLANAVKYTATRDEAAIEVGAIHDNDREVTIFVRDNGVGFDMQYVHKLFGVFQRLHRAEEFEGTGIGLANVRRIVQRHGGRVWAEGALNAGATFYFSLPYHAESHA